MKHLSINKTSILDTLKHGPPISCLSTGYMNDQRIKFSTKILLLSCTQPVTKPINLEFHKIFNHILKFPPQISMTSLHAIHKILSISTNETLLSPPPFFFLLQNSHNFSFDLIDFRQLQNFVTWSLLPTSNWTIYMRRSGEPLAALNVLYFINREFLEAGWEDSIVLTTFLRLQMTFFFFFDCLTQWLHGERERKKK